MTASPASLPEIRARLRACAEESVTYEEAGALRDGTGPPDESWAEWLRGKDELAVLEALADAEAARVGALADAARLWEALADAVQLVAKFEYLPYGATVARRVVGGVWITDDEVAARCDVSEHRCPTCGWPQRGHNGPGRYRGNAENSHEEGCSLRAVLDGEPALRLRRLTTRAALSARVSPAGVILTPEQAEQVLSLADRVMDEAMTRWHDAPESDPPTPAIEWLGVTWDEYSAWVERSGFWAALAVLRPGGAAPQPPEDAT